MAQGLLSQLREFVDRGQLIGQFKEGLAGAGSGVTMLQNRQIPLVALRRTPWERKEGRLLG